MKSIYERLRTVEASRSSSRQRSDRHRIASSDGGEEGDGRDRLGGRVARPAVAVGEPFARSALRGVVIRPNSFGDFRRRRWLARKAVFHPPCSIQAERLAATL